MKHHFTLTAIVCLAALLHGSHLCRADGTTPPAVQFQTGLAGNQVVLTWLAQPGARYRIRSSTTLTNPWRDRDVVVAEGTNASWMDPEATGAKAFYQIDIPQAQVFTVEPAVISPGGVLVLTGQSIPPGSSVVFEIEGMADVSAPIVVGPDGRMTVTLPTFGVVAGPGGGPHVKRAYVVAPGGATVCGIGQTFAATLSGFATDSPPVMPPAAQGAKRSEAELNLNAIEKKARTAPVPNIPPIPGMCPGIATLSAPLGMGTFTRIPGEVCVEQTDLALATPAGPPLAFVRTFRSMTQNASPAGTGWDHAYNIHVTPIYDSTTLTVPTRVAISNGDGSVDVMHRDADGAYRCDGLFREGRLNPDTSFTLTFADQMRFIFSPPVGGHGRIASIVDRNGVALTCAYAAGGLLSTVSSQFGQSLTLDYDQAGRVIRVTDQTGRFVRYNYYSAGESGGNPGDLKSVSCPTLPGKPPVPVRGDAVYTYSTGATNPRLNSNLLSVHDGAGRLVCAWTYSSSTITGDADFDRCVTRDRQSIGAANLPVFFSYEFIAAGGGGGAGGLLCIAIDELGRVTETRCDRMHRPVSVRAFTSFAAAGMPCTSTTNRPPGPPPGEPVFLETSSTWNPDHLCTRYTEADGFTTRTIYSRELQRDCPRIECGNARTVSIACTDNSQAPRVVSMAYQPGFGTCEGIKIPGVDHEFFSRKGYQYYQAKSQLNSAFTSKKGYDYYKAQSDLTSAGLHNNPAFQENTNQGTMPDRHHRGSIRPGNPIKGPIKRGRNPGGDMVSSVVNPLYDGESHGGENPLFEGRFCTRLTTAHGQVFARTYDPHGNCLTTTTPIAGSGDVSTYNALGQRTSITTLNGPGSSFGIACVYDPATHFLAGEVCDQGEGSGGGLALTTTFARDALGRVTGITDPRGFDTLTSYNACDQPVSLSSPPLGSARVVCTQTFDPSGLPVRCDLENRDAAGVLNSANPHYTSFCVYDARGRLIQDSTEQKPVTVAAGVSSPDAAGLENFEVRDYTLDAAGQCVRVSTPAACRSQASAAVCDFEYDAFGRMSAIITGGTGTPGAVRKECSYSLYGIMKGVRTVAAPPAESPTVSCTFDVWRRPATFTDEMGNVTECSYNDQTGTVTSSVYGEVKDIPGGRGNVLLARNNRSYTGGRFILDLDGAAPNLVNPPIQSLTIEPVMQPFGSVAIGRHAAHELTHVVQARGVEARLGADVTAMNESFPPPASFRPAFFDIFLADDTWVSERFAPGSTALPATETTTVHRSPAGLVQSVTCNGDTLASYTYDTAGRPLTCSNGACAVSVVRDACDNVTSSTVTAFSTLAGSPAETFTTTATFDALCRSTSNSDSMGNTHTRAFDSQGRRTLETLPGGLVIHHDYDTVSTLGAFSSVTHWTDYNGDSIPDVVISSLYLNGECASTTDAMGHTTTFTLDAQGRLTRSNYPDGTFEANAFDSLGNAVSHTRKSGEVIACDFDYKARARTITVSNLPPGVVPVPPTGRLYDGLDRCVQTTEGASTVACTFDSLGNLLSESQNGHTVSHTYNHRGENGVTYPDGSKFQITRDAQCRLLTFSPVTAAGVQPPLSVCDYSGFACVREARGNGVVTTYDIRSDGEPSLLLGGGNEDFSFGECVRSVITGPNNTVLENQITRRNRDQFQTQQQRAFGSEAAPRSRRQTFTLDGRNLATRCLTQIRVSPGGPVTTESDVNYVLDSRGQRTSATGGSNPGAYSSSELIPPGDRQMAQYSTWPGGPLTWDANGGLTHLSRGTGGMDLKYDAWSRLVEVSDPATGSPIANYTYDAWSRRISSTLPGGSGLPPTTTTFLYDGEMCVQELDGLGAPVRNFASAGGSILCIVPINGDPIYPHGGGSSIAQRDRTGVFAIACTAGPEEALRWTPLVPKPRDPISYSMITSNTGSPVEYFASDDACKPIFLTSDGLVRTGATSALTGFRWILRYASAGHCAWSPESGLFQCPDGVYSPELGQMVSKEKPKPKPKPSIWSWDLAVGKK